MKVSLKTTKKQLPTESFLPTPQRIMAIIQLCIAFSVLLWYGAQPFMGEYFELQSQSLLYKYVIGIEQGKADSDKLIRNKERFVNLPTQEKAFIKDQYDRLQQIASRPTFQKIKDGIHLLFIDLPPFKLAWILFALIIPILLLKKVEGSTIASWILPLLALGNAFDNQIHGYNPKAEADAALFPTEQNLVSNYLKENLSPAIWNQQIQLKAAWEDYLIQQWSSNNPHYSREKLLEEGEFQFTLARLKLRKNSPLLSIPYFLMREKVSPIYLFLYIIWNTFFAWTMNRSKKRKVKLLPS